MSNVRPMTQNSCSVDGASSVSAAKSGRSSSVNRMSMAIPDATANDTRAAAKAAAARLPCRLESTPKVERLVAGPVIRKAMPAPGLSPATSKAATSGVAEAAHTYIGKPSAANSTIANRTNSVSREIAATKAALSKPLRLIQSKKLLLVVHRVRCRYATA